jgi:nucleotide-binding universal stress UspA family protein
MGDSKVIVVGVDESEGAAAALKWAVAEAAASGASVRAVLAWTYLDQPARPGTERVFDPSFDEASATTMLDLILRDRLGDAAGDVEAVVSNDHAGPALIRHSTDAHLLVVGARGLGAIRSAMLGSISNYCLHHSSVPVGVIGPDASATAHPGPVVVGTDGSDHGKVAVAWAAAQAAARGSELQILVTWMVPAAVVGAVIDPTAFEEEANQVLATTVAEAAEVDPAPPKVTGQVTFGGAAQTLIDASNTAALTVLGSRGRGGFRSLLLGSTSQQVAGHAHGPVVIVPSGRTSAK